MPERNIPRYAVILTALYFVACILGFFAPLQGKRELLEALHGSFKPFLTLPPWKMFLFIFINNSVKSFVVLVTGTMFGLVPLLAVVSNGYILGIALMLASREVGMANAAKAVLPHGIVEIPAGILSAAYGLWLGVTFARFIRQRFLVGFEYQVRHAIRMFFLVAFPLFMLAALIETVLISTMGE